MAHSEPTGNANLPWFDVEEVIQRPRTIGILDWVCHL